MWCPRCKNDRAHRSHRKGVEEFLASIFAYYPYRCRECQHRFLHNRNETSLGPSAHPSTEREIRATRKAKDWQRKKRHLVIYGMALFIFLAFLYIVTRDRGPSDNGSACLVSSAVLAA